MTAQAATIARPPYMGPMTTTVLIWFRHDLRLADHPALAAALATGGRVLPVFVWDPEAAGDHAPGASIGGSGGAQIMAGRSAICRLKRIPWPAGRHLRWPVRRGSRGATGPSGS